MFPAGSIIRYENNLGVVKTEAKWARYYYWSRTEHEILVGGLFKNCKLEKIDIFRQIEMNLDRITEYVNKELKIEKEQKMIIHNKIKCKSY